jgi:hypothetical protein
MINRAAAVFRRLLDDDNAIPADPGSVDALTRRVAYLEAALEGLQDAVYRQDVVHDRQIADLRRHHPSERA